MSVAALTNDEEHFWRLVRILLDDVPNQLRSMFKSKFQLKYNVPWLDNQMSGAFFVVKCNTSRTPKHITGVIRQGNTAFFDSTALFTCLLFSGTGILLPTPRGKGARTGPIEDSERVDELREMRNEFAHATSTSLPQTSFIQKLALLNTIYAQLNWNPTVMRQWARDPVVTAECVNLQQQLTVERQRYIALDGRVQVLAADVTQIQGQQQLLRQDTTQLQQQQHGLSQDVTQLQQQHQEGIAALQQQQVQVSRHGEDIKQMKQHRDAAQMSTQRAKGELDTWRKQLIDAQRRMLERYVGRKNDEEDTTLQDLNDMFVNLRIHNSTDKYNRIETRIHHDHLQLQMEIERCPEISVKELFEPERPDMATPVRSLVVGSAGIGKSILSLHIVDQWLRNELLPEAIYQLFHFRLRDLSERKKCSLEELFFECQKVGKPSPQAIGLFFDELRKDPTTFVMIFDGLDEATVTPTENRAFAYDEQVEMSRLIASIINGYTLPSVRLLVTSRPGGVTNYDMYDKKAEIYGFTREKMSDYITMFSGTNEKVQKSINDYIDHHVNICSFCYIPAHLILVCRIVKARMQQESNLELPETLTELFAESIRNFLVNHHPELKDHKADTAVDVIARLQRPILDHAKLALYGMEQESVKVTFSKKEICHFHLEHVATQCGLVSQSRERGDVLNTPSSSFCFHHLTVQEFLAAVALVTNIKLVQRVTTTASNRQLDLVLIFLAGLLGNSRNHHFLCALHSRWWNSFQRSLQQKSAESLQELIKSVVARERTNEANTRDTSEAHKSSTMLLVTMIHESRQPELWHLVSDYILEGGTKLDLSNQHISPTEQQALAYVLPQTGLTCLNLTRCDLKGDEARNMLVAVGDLHGLTELSLGYNPGLHDATMSIVNSLVKLSHLERLDLTRCDLKGDEARNMLVAVGDLHGLTELRLSVNPGLHDAAMSNANTLVKLSHLERLDLGMCALDDEDVAQVATIVTSLQRLEWLWLGHNNISDVGALKVTQVAARHPSLERLSLYANCVTETGVEDIRRATHDTPRLRLVCVDWQRRPGEGWYRANVEGLQRQLTDLETALARLQTRALLDRDMWWKEDVDEIRRQVDHAQGLLLEVESERQSQH